MKISMSLDQKQVLMQQMIQTMNVLQMNTLELESYINEISMENPTIELLDNSESMEQSEKQIDVERKMQWLETIDHQNVVYYRDDEEIDREASWQDIKDTGESLAEYLNAQVIHKKFNEKERSILEYIICELDSSGYFKDDIEQTAAYFRVDVQEVERMLHQVQRLDPAGVGARNLEECLLIQMERTVMDKSLKEDTRTIIREYLPLVAKKHFSVVAKKMKIGTERVEECLKQIRSFNPKPGNSFNDRDHFHYVSPDVIVVSVKNQFHVLINEYQYPKFQVNAYYEEMAKTTDDRKTKEYLREKLKQTKELKDSIQYRISTLSEVAMLLVEKQKDFFRLGPGQKCPLQLSDFVEVLDLHVSTISRALSNKYLQCAWGIYPLNYFLTASMSNEKKELTQDKVIDRIEKLIESEDKRKPYSDQKIAELLMEEGIEISRRTVSKYRGIRGIPDKSGRKQLI